MAEVRNHPELFVNTLPDITEVLNFQMMSNKAGSLKSYLQKWQEFTSDPEILDTVLGMTIEFDDAHKALQPRANHCSKWEKTCIEIELHALMKKGVVKESSPEQGEILSAIFLRPKQDGSFRLILNLKQANQNIKNFHFKMETIHSVLKLIRPNCYMASVDIKDAYYSVPIGQEYQKYLKFQFLNKLYSHTCLPNGFAQGLGNLPNYLKFLCLAYDKKVTLFVLILMISVILDILTRNANKILQIRYPYWIP